MMVEFCQEKESKTVFEFNTFVFFFLKKTKKNARMLREEKYLMKRVLVKIFFTTLRNSNLLSNSLFLLLWDECLII